jgi:polyhydroxyalkanoate synthesis regulator protein
MKHWMFSCREISYLVSKSMDERIPVRQRLGVRMHLMMCRFCARYKRQLELLRRIMHHYAEQLQEQAAAELPPEARARIKDALRQAS